MRKVVPLALSFLREHPVCVVLTTISTAAATCLVLWIDNSYEALHRTYDEYANLALGRYELAIAPISMDSEDHVPIECLEDLRGDAGVLAADPMWATRLVIQADGLENPADSEANSAKKQDVGGGDATNGAGFGDGPGTGPSALMPDALFLATDAREPPFDLQSGRWLNAEVPDSSVCVVRADVANRRGISLDDTIVVERKTPDAAGNAEVQLRVVGIVAAPSLAGAEAAGIPILAPRSGEVFISTELAEQLVGETAQISLIGLSLHSQTDITKFRFGWAPRLSRYSTPVQFQEAYEIEEALDQTAAAQNVRLQSFAATGVAMLVSLLVVFCTLSMGVTERIRQYAILRAIAFTRAEVAALVVLEGVFLGTIGFVGGLMVGIGLLQLVAGMQSELLYHGAPIGATSLWLAGIAAVGGSLLAAAYVPLHIVEKLTGSPPKINLVELRLNPDGNADQLSNSLAPASPAAELLRPEDVRAKIASGFVAEGARKQAWFVTALSILASDSSFSRRSALA